MIDESYFSKSFLFRILSFQATKHTDNSRVGGIPQHFIARMRHGSAHIRALSGEEFVAKEGEVFYLPKGLRYHSYWFPNEETGCVEWESYGFEAFPNPNECRFLAQKLSPDTETTAILDTLYLNMSITPASVGRLYLFLDRVLPSMKRSDTDPHRILLEKIRTYIAEHPDLRVPQLAKHCHMSESALYAFMREYASISPIEFKNRLQAEKAAELLRTTDRSVEEISAELGFCSSAYFRKIFKEQLGKTPTALRRESQLI